MSLSNWVRQFQTARSLGQKLTHAIDLRLSDVRLYIPAVSNRTTGMSMGEHTEITAKEWHISREAQDQIALESHQHAVAAWDRGFFDDLVIPFEGLRRDTIPRKEIEATENEIASLTARANALGSGLTSRDTLVAPISGVIASASVVSGQVVDAREVLFEVIDPTRLRIEAIAFDPAMAADIGAATIAIGDKRATLTFVGATRSLREQALPLIFKANDASLSMLAIGQPVRVFVQSKTKVNAIAVPVSSLMKSSSNQTIVWVKTAPEKFEPRVVMTEALDGMSIAVTAGLKAGDRVATRGATLINQVR
mgnify:CR=1 FL=1